MEPKGLKQWQCSLDQKCKCTLVIEALAERLKRLVGVDFRANLRLSSALANDVHGVIVVELAVLLSALPGTWSTGYRPILRDIM